MLTRFYKTSYSFWLGLVTNDKPIWLRYAIAILMAPVTLSAIAVLETIDPEGHIFVINILGVLIVICWAGFWPGMVTAFLTSLGTDYFFIPPFGTVFHTPAGIIQLGVYMTISIMAGAIVAAFQHSLRKENELKEWAESCAEADRNVLYIVNHDLKSPLTGMAMQVALLARQLRHQISPAQLSTFEGVDTSIQRMTRIIDDMQEAGKIQAGHFSTDLNVCELGTLLQESIIIFRERAEAKKIRIQFLCDSQLPNIRSDASRILQVVSNFLSNAIKFAPERSNVNVQVSKEGDHMRVSVTNDGDGISSHDLPHVFERHWQAQGTKHLGMGLGLYIAKIIIQSLHGTIGVENHAGRGCTFYFSLPIN